MYLDGLVICNPGQLIPLINKLPKQCIGHFIGQWALRKQCACLFTRKQRETKKCYRNTCPDIIGRSRWWEPDEKLIFSAK
jgi:hypothetical protein